MPVMNFNFTGHAVQLKLDTAVSFSIRFRDSVKTDKEHLSFFYIHSDFLARFHAKEERRRIQDGQVAILMIAVHIITENFRINTVRGNIFFPRGHMPALHFCFHRGEVHILRMRFQMGFFPAQNNLLQLFRESAVRNTQFPIKEINHGLREIKGRPLLINIFFRQMVLHHEECHITDHFGRRRYFDNIAKHHIHSGIHAANFRPAVSQSHRSRLLAEIGELPSRHFMLEKRGIRTCHPAVHPCIVGTDALPVAVNRFQGFDIQFRLAGIVLERIVQRRHGRLARTV